MYTLSQFFSEEFHEYATPLTPSLIINVCPSFVPEYEYIKFKSEEMNKD